MLDYRKLSSKDRKVVNKELTDTFSNIEIDIEGKKQSELSFMLVKVHSGKYCSNCFTSKEHCSCEACEDCNEEEEIMTDE